MKALGQWPHCEARDIPPGCPQGPLPSFWAGPESPAFRTPGPGPGVPRLWPLMAGTPLPPQVRRLGVAVVEERGPGGSAVPRAKHGDGDGGPGHTQQPPRERPRLPGTSLEEVHLDRAGMPTSCSIASSIFSQTPTIPRGEGPRPQGRRSPCLQSRIWTPTPHRLPHRLSGRCEAGEVGAGARGAEQ